MAPPRVFMTGTTGYIGGDALFTIVNAHPDWEITCQVRNSDKGAKIAAAFPKVRLVYGDLDATDLIEEETTKTDIVYHFANCDHVPSANAIARGLAKRTSSTPAYWIHTSGTFILGWETIHKNAWGELLPKVYNDWDGVNELTSHPDDAPHRDVDKIVLAASASNEKIKTAIVCPPCICGQGRGPDNQRSVQVYNTTRDYLKLQKAFIVGKGENIWHQVHVQDLSDLYLKLGEAAAAGGAPATWDDQGYYLAENGEFVWKDVLKAVAQHAKKKGLLPSDDLESISIEDADKITKGLYRSTSSNSRGQAIRGRKLLGWEPKRKPLLDDVDLIVEGEAKTLGLVKGHAAQAAQ